MPGAPSPDRRRGTGNPATAPFPAEAAAATSGRQGATIPDQPVAADGAISVPYAGRVPAAGQTPGNVQQAIEALLAKHSASRQFCHGDRPTIADICLVTQVTPAKTFNCPLDPYPRVMRVYDTCMAIPAFADAHPAKQPDAE